MLLLLFIRLKLKIIKQLICATKFYEVRLFQIVRKLINIEYTKTAIFYKTI